MSTDGDPLSALVDRAYDAAVGFCGWDGILSDLARLLGGSAAGLGGGGPNRPGRGVRGWDGLLSGLARLLGGSAAVLGVVGPNCPGRIVHVGVDPACMARYLERHAGRNELEARAAARPGGAA